MKKNNSSSSRRKRNRRRDEKEQKKKRRGMMMMMMRRRRRRRRREKTNYGTWNSQSRQGVNKWLVHCISRELISGSNPPINHCYLVKHTKTFPAFRLPGRQVFIFHIPWFHRNLRNLIIYLFIYLFFYFIFF